MSTVLNVSDADKAKLTVREKNGRVSFSESSYIRTVSGTPKYEGEYEVTPTQETQTIPIQGMLATHNITVNPIPGNYGLITWNGSTLTVS